MTRETVTTVGIDRWRTRLNLVARAPEGARPHLLTTLTGEADRLESVASRFVRGSEVSLVNDAAGRWTEVSWLFVDVLTAALDAAATTDGLVTPCLGRDVDAAGYREWRDGSASSATPTPPPAAAPRTDTWREIEVTPAGTRARVRIPAGVSLDLGAVGKGWLADRLADIVSAALGCGVIADMGGDLRIVGAGEPWVVSVDPGTSAPHSLQIADGGLATSGTGRRQWRTADGTAAHHIIDPRTGRPAEITWSSASVLAADARGANTAATAAIILGPDAPKWLADRHLDAWLVGPGGQTRVGRWPAQEQAA